MKRTKGKKGVLFERVSIWCHDWIGLLLGSEEWEEKRVKRERMSSLQGKIGLAFKREGLVLTGKDVMEYLVSQLKEHSSDAQVSTTPPFPPFFSFWRESGNSSAVLG